MTRPRLLACAIPVLLLAASGGPGDSASPRTTDPPVRREAAPPQLSLYLPIPQHVPGVDGLLMVDHHELHPELAISCSPSRCLIE